MSNLVKKIDKNALKMIEKRLKEFEEFGKNGKVIFDFKPFLNMKLKAKFETEIIFCISVANSSAISGLKLQKKLENVRIGLLSKNIFENLMKESGVRFYQRKSEYAELAIKNFELVEMSLEEENDRKARKFLLKLKGIGWKEASHFLRNVGRKNLSIIDRHILKWLFENDYISAIPKTLSPRKYLKIEKILEEIAEENNINLAMLDLILWYRKTGKILK